MKSLLILGAGGHGKVVADAALASGLWSSLRFLDDRYQQLGHVLDCPVIGPVSALYAVITADMDLVVALGNAAQRLEFLVAARARGIRLGTVVHPAAVISRYATLGEGTVVLATAVVNASTSIGMGCIINTGAVIEHDCRLDDGVHACPQVGVAGNVSVGKRTWLGIGCVVREGLEVGADVTVGAGAVVVNDVPAGLTVVGVPARVLGSRA